MDKCFLCKAKSYITVNGGGTCIDILDGNRLDIDFNCSHEPCINIEINFCPICGRKLTIEKEKGYEIVDEVGVKNELEKYDSIEIREVGRCGNCEKETKYYDKRLGDYVCCIDCGEELALYTNYLR